MNRFAIAALAASLLVGIAPLATPAVAQDFGFSIRSGDGPRARFRAHDDDDVVIHRRDRMHTGSIGNCRTVTVRRTNEFGDTVVRKTRRCD